MPIPPVGSCRRVPTQRQPWAQAKAAGTAEVTIERVLKEYARIAFADIAQADDGDGNFLPVAKMPEEDIRRTPAGVEITEPYGNGEQIGQRKKVRFAQKVPALESLARYLGMFHVGAVGSAGLHISLHLGEGPDEPKPAIAAPALPVATNRLSGGSPCARGCWSE